VVLSIFLSFFRILVIKIKSRKISIAAKRKSCQYVDVNRICMDFYEFITSSLNLSYSAKIV